VVVKEKEMKCMAPTDESSTEVLWLSLGNANFGEVKSQPRADLGAECCASNKDLIGGLVEVRLIERIAATRRNVIQRMVGALNGNSLPRYMVVLS
jgi:hypothetical protein